MRNYTPVERKYTTKVLTSITCDICGDTSSDKWKENSFDVTEVEVNMRTGEMYGNDGSGENVSIDICPKCFTGKLMPWVKSFGGEPTITEWDT